MRSSAVVGRGTRISRPPALDIQHSRSSLLRCPISVLCSPPSLAGGGNGVTSFLSSITPGSGRAFRPVVRHPRRGSLQPLTLTTYFWARAWEHLGLVFVYGLYGPFSGVALSRRAGPSPP